jgi:hypothetical protein
MTQNPPVGVIGMPGYLTGQIETGNGFPNPRASPYLLSVKKPKGTHDAEPEHREK